MKCRTKLILIGVLAVLTSVSLYAADPSKAGQSLLDNLPPHIRQLPHFGQRADFSHDGKRILFLERTFGDVFELEIATTCSSQAIIGQSKNNSNSHEAMYI